MIDYLKRFCDSLRVIQLVVVQVELKVEFFFFVVFCNCRVFDILVFNFCDVMSYYYICLEGFSISNLIFLKVKQSL